MNAQAISTLAYSSDAVSGAAPALLAVRQLRLTDFRNYRQLRLDCGQEPVVLVGANGAGKTNLLEALSFLAPGRGLRRARLDDVCRRARGDEPSAAGWAAAATLDTPEGRLAIGTGLEAGRRDGGLPRRAVRIDGRPMQSQTALRQHVAAVWLTPQLDRLFLDGASERRRFLDRLVTALHPEHAGDVAAYENAMRQRGRGSFLFSNNNWALRGRKRQTGESLYYPRAMMRVLSQVLSEEYGPLGVHVANVVIDGLIAREWGTAGSAFKQRLLPGITLALFTLAPIARMTRASMLQALSSEYLRTARAAGLSSSRVLMVYAFRNALLPVVTTLGMVFSFTLGANVLVEKVFAWPGIGMIVVDAINGRDYPVVQAAVMVTAMFILLLNLVVDLIYSWLDPRLRY